MNNKELRERILELTAEYHNELNAETKPRTYVPTSGKVIGQQALVNLVDASLDMWLTAARYADEFEKRLAAYIGVRYSLLVNSGSSANLLAVSALTSPLLGEKRIKPGDEIITVGAGFPTTVAPIVQNGCVPVFVDVDPRTYNVDLGALKKAVSSRTRAIILAHTLGNPFDVDGVMAVVSANDLWLIEDNCDALGSIYKGKKTGRFGHLATYSFYPAHHITMGEGGAVSTDDPLLYKAVKSLRDWGRDCVCPPGQDNLCGQRFNHEHGTLPQGYDHKYVYSHFGYNLKVTDMQAAVGLAQLDGLDDFIQKRKHNFELMSQLLLPFSEWLQLPVPTAESDPSWFGYLITIKDNAPFDRNKMVRFLEEHDIGTRLLFAGNMTRQPMMAHLSGSYRVEGSLDVSDIITERTFWIGLWHGLNDHDISRTCKTIATFIKEEIKG